MQCLSSFSSMSGLHPSLHKSMVFFSNCDAQVTNWFDSTYGIPHGILPVKFLGVPLISSKLSINDCVPLVEKITSRINFWTSLLLSLAGRMQLIRSVLLSIQFYWSNHFVLPNAVHKLIRKLLTRFLWKGDITKIGGAKVGWDSVCLPFSEGGIGLKDTTEWNSAQIMMHLCRVEAGSKTLWATWIHATSFKHKHLWTLPMPTDCSWIWKKILKLRVLARQFISYQLGDGRNTWFWFDPWWNNRCLAQKKTDLIITQLGLPWHTRVGSVICDGSWSILAPSNRLRHLDPGLVDFLDHFDNPSFNLASSDRILWGNMAITKVKPWHIWDTIRHRRIEAPWHHLVWHKLKILRYAYHQWLVCLGRTPTLDRLSSFGLHVPVHCYLCVGGLETIDHLFLHCTFSASVLAALGTHLHLTIRRNNWLDHMHDWGLTADKGHTFLALLSLQVYCYHIWREHNERAHDKGTFTPTKLLKGIMSDIRTKIHSCKWFLNSHCIGLFSSWLA